jgi:hypothetical protein
MSRATDRAAARREARIRRAELRLFTAARRYRDALDRAAADPQAAAQVAETEALTALEAAALHYGETAPPPRRRRRARSRA